jgi:hypothetical protein
MMAALSVANVIYTVKKVIDNLFYSVKVRSSITHFTV